MIIQTKAPIAIEDLKKHFTNDGVKFLIHYGNSDLKGEKLLTYLSNLDLPCDLTDIDNELLKDYFHSTSLLNCPELEEQAIDVLLQFKTIDNFGAETQKFISENLDIVKKWTNKLDSLSLYNMYMVNEPKFKEYAESFTHDDTDELEGINFISILKNTRFYEFYKHVQEKELKFYTKYFNEYMFRGKNMYSYWANANNPMFLLTKETVAGRHKDYMSARNKELGK